jgi:hypothetical protein
VIRKTADVFETKPKRLTFTVAPGTPVPLTYATFPRVVRLPTVGVATLVPEIETEPAPMGMDVLDDVE